MTANKVVEVIRSSERDMWDVRDPKTKEVIKTCKCVKLKNVDFVSETLTEEERETYVGCGQVETSTVTTEYVGYARGELLEDTVKFKDIPVRVMFNKLKGFFQNYHTEKEVSQRANFLHVNGWAFSDVYNEAAAVKPAAKKVDVKAAEGATVQVKTAEKAKPTYVQIRAKNTPTPHYVAVKK